MPFNRGTPSERCARSSTEDGPVTDRYGVMGHPIEHSKSPFIHTCFAEQTKQSMNYRPIHVLPGAFPEALAAFQSEGGKGLNITLPFKEEASRAVDKRTPGAERAGAVNTIWFDESGVRHGDNTDGVGLVRDMLVNRGMSVRGKRVLLLGAGGAARGVVGPLLDEAPEAFVVANRTRSRAMELAGMFLSEGSVEGCGLADLRRRSFDIVINATSASLHGVVPVVPDTVLAPGGWCYDLMYGDEPTAFVRWGEARGAAQCVDGLGMLVEQAAESFLRWRGIRPETAPVINALRRRM